MRRNTQQNLYNKHLKDVINIKRDLSSNALNSLKSHFTAV